MVELNNSYAYFKWKSWWCTTTSIHKMSKVWHNLITVTCVSTPKVNGWKESVFVETILLKNLKTENLIEV